ncbi:FT-interacting protein 3 [Linum perenne]
MAADSTGGDKSNLIVEIVAAHNLLPKDGERSSSPYVEVEFETHKLRTQVRNKDLNPIWNEKLIFPIGNVADLPYRTIDVSVFNDQARSRTRNFLGKVRVSGSTVSSPETGESVEVRIYSLDKRSLFSHVRGEITLKVYVSNRPEERGNGFGNGFGNGKKMKTKNEKKQLQSREMAFQEKSGKGFANEQIQQNGQATVLRHPGQIMMNLNPASASSAVGNGGYSSMEFAIKETNPHLGGGKGSSAYDLVEQMQYLYVRVVKAKNIGTMFGEIVAEVKLGNYRGITKRATMATNLEWNQVFAFSKDCIQSSMAEIFIKEAAKDEYLGRVWFDLNEVPFRAPPDSPLAPQWYRMEHSKSSSSTMTTIMASIWFGTQADESFAEAWHSKAANVPFDGLCSIKSKVYLSPKLWYLRASVLEAQDIVVAAKGSSSNSIMRFPELYAKLQVGNQILRTRIAGPNPNRNNEDLLFVVAEPFEDYLTVSIEDREETVGRVSIPVNAIERRYDKKQVVSRWFILNHLDTRFGSRVHLRLCLDGGYHVLDEATMYISDVRASAKQLWKDRIGVLEMGILGATGLMPMKLKHGGVQTTDAYCVAKYGQKWVRTRTAVDSLSPKWNEQYTWEVFDPCTVVTIGVFDNSRVEKKNATMITSDSRIGKVRIRLSTLESDRVYTHSYPLLMLHPTGVKKMGEIHLAVRFSCANAVNMMNMYTLPLLPKMHYLEPLSVSQVESLRHQAMNMLSSRLSRAEPPLGKEVVEYMLDHDSHLWSMRRSKANFARLINVLSGVVAFWRTFESMRNWDRPVRSTIFVLVFMSLVMMPELIMPSMLVTLATVGLWRYHWSRPRHPPHMDTRLSNAENVHPDELDEEFDSFPTSRNAEIVRMRYDRVRSMAGRIQTVVGDMATQGERVYSLVSWRDPRASFLFVVGCLVAAITLYEMPVRVVVGVFGLYIMRPPRFRNKLPSMASCFFKRLPTKADSLL